MKTQLERLSAEARAAKLAAANAELLTLKGRTYASEATDKVRHDADQLRWYELTDLIDSINFINEHTAPVKTPKPYAKFLKMGESELSITYWTAHTELAALNHKPRDFTSDPAAFNADESRWFELQDTLDGVTYARAKRARRSNFLWAAVNVLCGLWQVEGFLIDPVSQVHVVASALGAAFSLLAAMYLIRFTLRKYPLYVPTN